MRIIAFDPGMAKLGWAVGEVFDEELIIQYAGVMNTKKNNDLTRWEDYETRIGILRVFVKELFRKYKSDLVVMEQFNFYGNFTSAITPISLVIGMIITLVHNRGQNIVWFNSITLKHTVCGSKKATKKDVREKMSEYIVNKEFDACDAAALIYTWNAKTYGYKMKSLEGGQVE